ncbi:hypothetical protein BKA70DRAFT_1243139 [Coprinopsis sp. MPI-PUGE-AT-0042]|nr:hypothetical protein BKA70DRAFT_1243139 [Coprinopsis sp. MPI-PUGE-AT-0042]
MIHIPQALSLSLHEWQNLLDYLSARLRDCAQLFITEVQFKDANVRAAYCEQFQLDITQTMVIHSAATLACSSAVSPPPCLQTLFLLVANSSLENIPLLSRATGYQYPCFDAIPSHVIVNAWWRSDAPQSYGAADLVLCWREQMTRPGMPTRRHQAAIHSVFDNLTRKSLQDAVLLGREALVAAEDEVKLAQASFNEHQLAISRLEVQCSGRLYTS